MLFASSCCCAHHFGIEDFLDVRQFSSAFWAFGMASDVEVVKLSTSCVHNFHYGNTWSGVKYKGWSCSRLLLIQMSRNEGFLFELSEVWVIRSAALYDKKQNLIGVTDACMHANTILEIYMYSNS